MSVVIFTKTTCPHCVKAKALLATKTHISPVHVVDVTEHPERIADLRARGLTTVPQIFINGVVVEGGNAGLQALEAAGELDAMLAAATQSAPTADAPLPLAGGAGLLAAAASPDTSESAATEYDSDDDALLPGSEEAAVYVMHDNAAWFEPYRVAFKAAGVPFVEWDMGSGSLDLDVAPPEGIFFNRVSVSSHTRGSRFSVEHAASVVAHLEAHGRTVFGGSNALSLEASKAKQVPQLARFGVASPRTSSVVGHRGLIATIKRRLAANPNGVIVKPNRGGSGAGVRLVRSVDDARRYLRAGDFDGSLDDTLLVQDFIPSPEAAMYRLEFVGGKFLYAVKVDTSHIAPAAGSAAPSGAAPTGDLSNCPLGEDAHPAAPTSFSNCPADSCNVDAGEASTPKFVIDGGFDHPELVSRMEAFLHANDIFVAGIEVVFDVAGEAFVIDANVINTNQNRAAEAAAGVSHAVDAVVAQLGASLEAERRGLKAVGSASNLSVASSVSV